MPSPANFWGHSGEGEVWFLALKGSCQMGGPIPQSHQQPKGGPGIEVQLRPHPQDWILQESALKGSTILRGAPRHLPSERPAHRET